MKFRANDRTAIVKNYEDRSICDNAKIKIKLAYFSIKSDMAYPPAPWTLKGYAILTLQLVDISQVRPLIPKELEIISLWPGKTLGGVYLASYTLGSVMEYNELIVVSAIANLSGKWGAWVSHIYVDNPNSVAGGREIWGLPKEMAEFNWENSDRSRIIVTQGNCQLCTLSYSQPSFSWPLPLSGNVFSSDNSNLLWFNGEFESRVSLINTKLEIPPQSPFASLNLDRPWLSFSCEDMRLIVSAPTVAGIRSLEFSY